jgi:hypothetical protein
MEERLCLPAFSTQSFVAMRELIAMQLWPGNRADNQIGQKTA